MFNIRRENTNITLSSTAILSSKYFKIKEYYFINSVYNKKNKYLLCSQLFSIFVHPPEYRSSLNIKVTPVC